MKVFCVCEGLEGALQFFSPIYPPWLESSRRRSLPSPGTVGIGGENNGFTGFFSSLSWALLKENMNHHVALVDGGLFDDDEIEKHQSPRPRKTCYSPGTNH
jgi:hypothetical protein